jgi:hypothetical protein
MISDKLTTPVLMLSLWQDLLYYFTLSFCRSVVRSFIAALLLRRVLRRVLCVACCSIGSP